jgi:hypothetical protein
MTTNQPDTVRYLAQQARRVLDTPFAKRLRAGEVDTEEFKRFTAQRLLMAEGFSDLLNSGMSCAESVHYDALHDVLEANYDDEMGIIRNEGSVREEKIRFDHERSHTTQRADYARALGITQRRRDISTGIYCGSIQTLVDRGHPIEIAGAVLFVEYLVPREFAILKAQRDRLFPEKLLDRPEDDDAVKSEKERARRYLDDHIHHDAAEHYPVLLKAARHPRTDKSLHYGIKWMADARREFYLDFT